MWFMQKHSKKIRLHGYVAKVILYIYIIYLRMGNDFANVITIVGGF